MRLLWRGSKLIAATLTLLGVFLIAGTSESGMLLVQRFFNLPGSQFQIGSVIVRKPDTWVLLASRDSLHHAERLLGFFPRLDLLSGKRGGGPIDRYFTFRDLSMSVGTITFVELAPEEGDALNEDFLGKVKQAQSKCYWVESRLFDFRALECRSKEAAIYVLPEARVMIINSVGSGILSSFRVERVAAISAN